MQWLLLSSSVIGLYVFSILWSFWTNYAKARVSGFPMFFVPCNPNNPIWMVLSVPLRSIFYRSLPSFAFERIKYTIYGWEFQEKATESPRRSDPAFLLVTPGRNELWVEDPDLANTILARRKDFVQFEVASLLMGIFGNNVITSDGDDWQRHRKLVAPVLNEKISELVWRESSRQARDMLKHHLKANEGRPADTIYGLRQIAINVLALAGYGNTQCWEEQEEQAPPGHQITYMDALHAVRVGFIIAALVPARILSLPIMPKTARTLGIAVQEFPVYTKEMLAKERAVSASSTQRRHNLMSALVRASDAEKGSNNKSSQSLSEAEIQGNLFQFTLAGFDTTANTMAYAVTNLVAYPEWQDWIIEEIDHVLQPQVDPDDYEAIFPKLGRCLALMYEILRLYTPVAHISRQTDHPQQLVTSNKTYLVPAKTTVYINIDGIQCDQRIWGNDALVFRPSRWLSEKSTIANPDLIAVPRGVFLPWSAGPRICPGMKMAQVEFVAVMAKVFKSCRISTAVAKGETEETARDRLKELMKDSQPRLTLQMNRPDEAIFKWHAR